jgi:hypothetical protein
MQLIPILITLLLAHLLIDFLAQSNHKNKIFWLAVHSLLHGLAAYLLLAAWTVWLVPVVIAISHFLIDSGTSRLRQATFFSFLIDQGLHGAVITGLAIYASQAVGLPFWLAWQNSITWPLTVLVVAALLLVPCGGTFIELLVKPFQNQLTKHYRGIGRVPVKGLVDGGRIIGYLERLLILIFVLLNQYAGIGFLVAAKSIFRFGEFKDSENRMEAEYIIIGTFASFLYAIVVGWAAFKLMGII